MVEKKVRVVNKTGLHARPATQFVEKARQFKSKIVIEKNGSKADAKSILGILSLGLSQGTEIKILAAGEDEQEAVEELVELLNSFEARGC